jgi:phosphohistidine phosphatase
MARWIEANDVHPELVLCSSAVRARETLAQLEHVLGSPRIVIADSLYGASAAQLADRLGRVPPGTREVMIVGHNPGLADLCLLLARGSRARQQVAVKFPTGALATLETGSLEVALSGAALHRARITMPLRRDEKPWLVQRELERILGQQDR